MCNDYQVHIEWEQYCAALAAAELGLPVDATPADLPARDDIRVKDSAPVLVASGNVAKLVPMRWGFPPARAKAAPVFNFRSEGRSFADSKRCVVPASAFFEFTGSKYPKTKWRFELHGDPVLGIAGLWREADLGEQSFTLLTTEPGPDIQPYHNRQVAILRARDWGHWLYLDRSESELLGPLPEGSLAVTLERAGRDYLEK